MLLYVCLLMVSFRVKVWATYIYIFLIQYTIFINGGHAKKQWDRVHASEAYEALSHCFPLFSCLISLACMHLVPLFYACLREEGDSVTKKTKQNSKSRAK